MPREIVCLEPRKPVYRAYEERPLQPDEVRARVLFASPKHGTEMHAFRGDAPQITDSYDEAYRLFLPRERQADGGFRPGNMWVGEVTAVGAGVGQLRPGQRVAGYGPLRETQTAAADRLLTMPEGMSWQQAVCYDPCQFALQGVRDSRLRLGDACLVIGLGAIGQMAAQMARLAGAGLVVVSDPIEGRRRIALQNGADVALDPARDDVGLAVKELTAKLGADAVLETSGHYAALQQALRGVAYGGRIAVVGWYGPCGGQLDLGREAHFNNATLFFSRACSEPNPEAPRWSWDRVNARCWAMLCENQLQCDNIIDPVVPFDEAAEAYLEYVDLHPEKSVKMGVRY